VEGGDVTIQSYRDLEVWQKAMDLVTKVYEITKFFPESERFGLTTQLRRAAVSIPSNIAEGQGRRTTNEFLSFLSIARGSLMEVQTQVEIAARLSFVTTEFAVTIEEQSATIGRLLNGLIRSLNQRSES
jgi:four helix bundle protein